MSTTKSDFINDNMPILSFASIKTNQQNITDFTKFCKSSETDFMRSSLLKLHAFISAYEAGEVITQNPNYSNEIKAIVQRMGSAAKEITSNKDFILELIYYLYDEEKFEPIFGFPINARTNSFVLNFDVFKSSLNFIFKNSFGEYIKSKPKEYLEVLSEIKSEIKTTVFIEMKLVNYFKYVCLFEILMMHLPNLGQSKLYFIKDFVFFNVNMLQCDKSCYQLKRGALSVFNHYFDVLLKFGIEVFKDYLSDLTRSFTSVVESVKEHDIRNYCLEVLRKLICDNYKHFGESIEKIDSFPNTSDYDDIREIYNQHHSQLHVDGLRGDIENFLRDCNRGADGLRSFKNNVS